MRTGMLIAALGTAITALPPLAAANCGQAFCPIESTVRAERPPRAKELAVEMGWEYIDQDQPQIGVRNVAVGSRPANHDEIETVNRNYRIFLEYGVTSRWSAGFIVPVVHRTHRHAEPASEGGGAPADPGHVGAEDEPIESWTFTAVGDAQVWARYSLLQPSGPRRTHASIAVGLKLPTGETGIRNGEGEVAEITLQPGSGSVEPTVGGFASRSVLTPSLLGARWLPLFVSATARLPGSDGEDGYRPGTDAVVTAGGAYPLFPRVELLAQANFRFRDRDEPGEADVQRANTGGEYLFFSPGVRLRMLDRLFAYAFVQLPVYQRVNGIQLTSDWNVSLGMTYRMDLGLT